MAYCEHCSCTVNQLLLVHCYTCRVRLTATHLQHISVVPEAVHKVGGMLMDLHVQEEPHKFSQHDLTVSRLLATCQHNTYFDVTGQNTRVPVVFICKPLIV